MEILSTISKSFNYSQAKRDSFIGWGSKILNNWNLYKANIDVSFPFCIPYIKTGRDFLGSEGLEMPHFHCRGHGSYVPTGAGSPGQGPESLQAARK